MLQQRRKGGNTVTDDAAQRLAWETELAAAYEVQGVQVQIRRVVPHDNGVLAFVKVRVPLEGGGWETVHGLRLRPSSHRPRTNPWRSQGVHIPPEALAELAEAFAEAAREEKSQ